MNVAVRMIVSRIASVLIDAPSLNVLLPIASVLAPVFVFVTTNARMVNCAQERLEGRIVSPLTSLRRFLGRSLCLVHLPILTMLQTLPNRSRLVRMKGLLVLFATLIEIVAEREDALLPEVTLALLRIFCARVV